MAIAIGMKCSRSFPREFALSRYDDRCTTGVPNIDDGAPGTAPHEIINREFSSLWSALSRQAMRGVIAAKFSKCLGTLEDEEHNEEIVERQEIGLR